MNEHGISTCRICGGDTPTDGPQQDVVCGTCSTLGHLVSEIQKIIKEKDTPGDPAIIIIDHKGYIVCKHADAVRTVKLL